MGLSGATAKPLNQKFWGRARTLWCMASGRFPHVYSLGILALEELCWLGFSECSGLLRPKSQFEPEFYQVFVEEGFPGERAFWDLQTRRKVTIGLQTETVGSGNQRWQAPRPSVCSWGHRPYSPVFSEEGGWAGELLRKLKRLGPQTRQRPDLEMPGRNLFNTPTGSYRPGPGGENAYWINWNWVTDIINLMCLNDFPYSKHAEWGWPRNKVSAWEWKKWIPCVLYNENSSATENASIYFYLLFPSLPTLFGDTLNLAFKCLFGPQGHFLFCQKSVFLSDQKQIIFNETCLEPSDKHILICD